MNAVGLEWNHAWVTEDGITSYLLMASKLQNEINDHRGQEHKIYTIVKASETFYHYLIAKQQNQLENNN